jgi:hypothetical protein
MAKNQQVEQARDEYRRRGAMTQFIDGKVLASCSPRVALLSRSIFPGNENTAEMMLRALQLCDNARNPVINAEMNVLAAEAKIGELTVYIAQGATIGDLSDEPDKGPYHQGSSIFLTSMPNNGIEEESAINVAIEGITPDITALAITFIHEGLHKTISAVNRDNLAALLSNKTENYLIGELRVFQETVAHTSIALLKENILAINSDDYSTEKLYREEVICTLMESILFDEIHQAQPKAGTVKAGLPKATALFNALLLPQLHAFYQQHEARPFLDGKRALREQADAQPQPEVVRGRRSRIPAVARERSSSPAKKSHVECASGRERSPAARERSLSPEGKRSHVERAEASVGTQASL